MKIVKISGGLGNQMFAYAFALALQKAGHEVFTDTSLYKTKTIQNGIDFCHNGLEVERLFGLVFPEAGKTDIRRLSVPAQGLFNRIKRKYFTPKTHYIDTVFSYTPSLISEPGDRYLEGYWQTEKYFAPIADNIRSVFTFRMPLSQKSAALKAEIEKNTAGGGANGSVSLHIRRGDYLNTKSLYVCTQTYYNKAIAHTLSEQPVSAFYVFSDDMDWCRTNLNFCGAKTVFADWNRGQDSWQDMALMSLCRCNIIANSSFSWWAAWLNRNTDKRIYAPAVWNRRELEYKDPYYKYDYSDIVPESWIRIPIK